MGKERQYNACNCLPQKVLDLLLISFIEGRISTHEIASQGTLFHSRNCLLEAQSRRNNKVYAVIINCMDAIINAGVKWGAGANGRIIFPTWTNEAKKYVSARCL